MKQDDDFLSHTSDLSLYLHYVWVRHVKSDMRFAAQVARLEQELVQRLIKERNKATKQNAVSAPVTADAREMRNEEKHESTWAKKTHRLDEDSLKSRLKSAFGVSCDEGLRTKIAAQWRAIEQYAQRTGKGKFMSYATFNAWISGKRTSSKAINSEYIEIMEGYCSFLDRENSERWDKQSQSLCINRVNENMQAIPVQEEEEVAIVDPVVTDEDVSESVAKATQRIRDLISPLSSPDLDRVNEERFCTDDSSTRLNEIVASAGGESVTNEAMRRLRPLKWLSSDIINFFMKNWLTPLHKELCSINPSRMKIHFMTSFFVQSLFDDRNKDKALRGVYNYSKVKNYGQKSPGGDIFGLKYLIIPVNLNNKHWVLAVICMAEKKIRWFDSLGGTNDTILRGLLSYLKDEWKSKVRSQPFQDTDWELVNCPSDLPRQNNTKDCGVFLCLFAAYLSLELPLDFGPDSILNARARIGHAVINGY